MTIGLVGASMLGMAALGLWRPGFYLGFIGYSITDPSRAAFQLGELRAIYGGLFGVIGTFTVLSAIDPLVHRGRLMAMGWCWLGIGAGRLLGVMVDGNPGLRGWGLLGIELGAGVLVLLCTPEVDENVIGRDAG
jgi:hypothetical protein